MTWDNGAGNLQWSTSWPANWEGDVLPGAGDQVIFGDAGVGIITLVGQTHTIDALAIQNASGMYDFVLGTLNLNRVDQDGAAARLSIAVKDRSAGLTLDVAGGDLTLAGKVTAASLTKTGQGLALLGVSNTISGPVHISAGTLAVGHQLALGSATAYLEGGNLEIRTSGSLVVHRTSNDG